MRRKKGRGQMRGKGPGSPHSTPNPIIKQPPPQKKYTTLGQFSVLLLSFPHQAPNILSQQFQFPCRGPLLFLHLRQHPEDGAQHRCRLGWQIVLWSYNHYSVSLGGNTSLAVKVLLDLQINKVLLVLCQLIQKGRCPLWPTGFCTEVPRGFIQDCNFSSL